MKVSGTFKEVIQEYLNKRAEQDTVFAEKLKNKKIDDCITYILNQVQKSGINGFADEEIFGMAVHFFDEPKLKPGSKINAKVIINQSVELTPKEIEEARIQAKAKLVEEEMERLRKPKKAKKADDTKSNELSLF